MHRETVELLVVGGPGMGQADPDGYHGHWMVPIPREELPAEFLHINAELWLEFNGNDGVSMYRRKTDDEPVAMIP